MTELTITPRISDKTARFKGTVAAGEHVAVSVAGGGIAGTQTLRLRVVGPGGRTLAQFPAEENDAWGADFTCELNLNTVQMLKAVPPGARIPLLFVLDDYDNKTLYFKDLCEVVHWPRRTGEEEPSPVNLDGYKDIIEDFETRLSGAEDLMETASADASDAKSTAASAAATAAEADRFARDAQANAANAASAAQTAVNGANAAVVGATNAVNDAQAAVNDANAAVTEANNVLATAQEVAATAQANVIEVVKCNGTALPVVNKAVDVAVPTKTSDLVNDGGGSSPFATEAALSAENIRATNAEQSLENAFAARMAPLETASESHTSQLSQLSQSKADKATTYTKTEVDAKVAGVQTFRKLLVDSLPAIETADDKAIYLVPRGDGDEPDLCDEYVVAGEGSSRRWERIGGSTASVDLSAYASKDYVKDVLNYKPIAVNTFTVSPSTAELGSTVSSVTLSYALNKAAASATLDGAAVSLSGASGTISRTGLSLKANKTWTLKVTEPESPAADAVATASKSATLSFLNRVYWGAKAAPAQIDSAFILGLGSSELSGSRARTKTVTAGAGQYIWFAYPARLGAATFKVGGFEGGFTLVDGSFSHTNASGYTEAYRVYRSDNAGLGATTVVVS